MRLAELITFMREIRDEAKFWSGNTKVREIGRMILKYTVK
jgi:hypothetical protein